MLSLGGEVCMRALTLADTTATLVHFASLKTLRLRSTGTTLPSVIASWTTLEILEIKVAGPEEPTAGKIKHWHTALAYRRQAEVITLQLPEELSQLTALRALCVDFADRRLGMHPGLCSRLEAPAQLSQLGKLESLRLRQCSLVGGGWRHVWPGLTSLTDLRFNSCLGSSLSQEVMLPPLSSGWPRGSLISLAMVSEYQLLLMAGEGVTNLCSGKLWPLACPARRNFWMRSL